MVRVEIVPPRPVEREVKITLSESDARLLCQVLGEGDQRIYDIYSALYDALKAE